MPRLTEAQKRKAREKLARERRVSTSSISDVDIAVAVDAGFITSYDYGSSYSCDTSSFSDGGCSSF